MVDTKAECSTCRAVAGGGRIRMTSEGAELLELLLRDKESEQLQNRKLAKEVGGPVSGYNDRIALVRQLLGEVERTQTEMGWLGGQPQPTHP